MKTLPEPSRYTLELDEELQATLQKLLAAEKNSNAYERLLTSYTKRVLSLASNAAGNYLLEIRAEL